MMGIFLIKSIYSRIRMKIKSVLSCLTYCIFLIGLSINETGYRKKGTLFIKKQIILCNILSNDCIIT